MAALGKVLITAKSVARPGVGYDTVDLAACTARRIPVTIAAANDQSVADFAIGLMLNLARGINVAARGVDMRARGFDMRLLAVDDYRDAQMAAQCVVNPEIYGHAA